MKHKKRLLLITICPLLLSNTVNTYAGLLSTKNPNKVEQTKKNKNAAKNSLLSVPSVKKEEEIKVSLLSMSYLINIRKKLEEDKLSVLEVQKENDISMKPIEEIDIQKVIQSVENENNEIINAQSNPSDYYIFREDMDKIYQRINIDAVNVIDRYMSKTKFIPVKDPLWFLAIGAVEYGYYNPDNNDIICSWSIDVSDYEKDENYMLAYNWCIVQEMLGDDAVTRRNSGAIGPFQLESFFGKGVEPVIPEEFGIIGSTEQRQDCWVALGESPGNGTSIIWQQGTYADRWSIADSANQTLAVYDETLRRVNGNCALTELDDKYEQVTMLMWAHNRGTGILGNYAYKEKVEKICGYLDELKKLVYDTKSSRFTRNSLYMQKLNEICREVGCDQYPVLSLLSYLIVEARYSGRW